MRRTTGGAGLPWAATPLEGDRPRRRRRACVLSARRWRGWSRGGQHAARAWPPAYGN